MDIQISGRVAVPGYLRSLINTKLSRLFRHRSDELCSAAAGAGKLNGTWKDRGRR